jgi:ABC-type transport system involved in multi-copper enzyme maturation permease subunit
MLQASFPGIIHGEFLKVARLFWLLFGLMAVGFLGALLLQGSTPHLNVTIQQAPLRFCYEAVESSLSIFRMLSGIFLLILTSFVIGRDYQYGTIRILLARGVGRIQLLFAKLALVALIGLTLLVAFALITAVFLGLLMLLLVGNLNALHALTPAFWSNAGRDLLTVLISMGATVLLAAAMNALGRSLTFGLSASLVWFPLDNFGTLLMNVIATLTHSDFWHVITSYLLGPLLNRLPDEFLPQDALSNFASFGAAPLVFVSTAHALSVIGIYALIFLTLALLPTWKRDVRE